MSGYTITPEVAPTIPILFRERVKQTPDAIAYREYDVAAQEWHDSSWAEMATEVARWQAALEAEGFNPGDRVGIMVKNCRAWVVFDQAAMGLGLVTVPLYVDDRPGNTSYIINHANIKLLLVQNKKQWRQLLSIDDDMDGLQRIICLESITEDDHPSDSRLEAIDDWVFGHQGELKTTVTDEDALASIVYTSGTTGRPKGVMLSHKNFLHNAWMSSQSEDANSNDLFLSFLPLSHSYERSTGYIAPMMIGATVAYNRSIAQLASDLITIKPTILVSVPRIYERVYGKIQEGLKEKPAVARKLFSLAVSVGWARFEYQQGRRSWSPKLLLWPLLNKLVASKIQEKLGGRLRVAASGGAALSPEVAKLFIGLGIPLVQGYGLTEASPVVAANRLNDNVPSSIGVALPGVEVRIGENSELQTRSVCVMQGYWKNEEATKEAFTEDGWLRTGDQARIDDKGHIYIIGRLKDIIVMANGEKVPPSDMETALILDSLFEQALVIGEGRAYLTALLVLNEAAWKDIAKELDVDPDDPETLKSSIVEKRVLINVRKALKDFPGYARIRRISLYLSPWTVNDGLMTPTFKLKRKKMIERFADDIEAMYRQES